MILKKEYNYFVNYWFSLLLITLIFIVAVGGLTRLTDSGLSITTWDVVTGILPPFNLDQWNQAFDLYKKIPQFYLMNQDITLSEFKVIYYWEYFHRLLGRFIGLLFLIPFIYFLIKKVFTREYNIKLSIIFCLILFQGFIGWYMVKSGLTENTTVSHFRLAIHLNIALILFSTIFWYFLNFLTKENKFFFYSYSGEKKIKIFVFIIFLQVTLGAFVSGLDAGQIYQTWPLMNDGYFPDDVNLYKIKISKIFYDPSIMQFLHRNLAYLISVYIIFIAIYIFYKKKKDLYFPVSILLFFVFVQVIMGILTLLSGLNILYASLHQLSSLLLLASSIYLCHKSIN